MNHSHCPITEFQILFIRVRIIIVTLMVVVGRTLFLPTFHDSEIPTPFRLALELRGGYQGRKKKDLNIRIISSHADVFYYNDDS